MQVVQCVRNDKKKPDNSIGGHTSSPIKTQNKLRIGVVLNGKA